MRLTVAEMTASLILAFCAGMVLAVAFFFIVSRDVRQSVIDSWNRFANKIRGALQKVRSKLSRN